MGVFSMLGSLVKGKVLVTTIVGAALLGTGGAALAATTTPTGQDIVHSLTGVHATVTPTHQSGDMDKETKASPTAKATEGSNKDGSKSCPGASEAQQLATKFSLSTDSKSSSMQVICTLHDGTFKGTDHALGYGEIDQLLTYAQSLAKKDNTTLADGNVQMYVATALKNCGSTAVAPCVNANMPDNHSNGSDNSNGHDAGKPTVTPTSHSDGKPTGTPTPHGN
jgi:hypothetical protein